MSVPLFPAFDARGDAATLPVEVVLPGTANSTARLPAYRSSCDFDTPPAAGPARRRPPRHRRACLTRFSRVRLHPATWRAISARPKLAGAGADLVKCSVEALAALTIHVAGPHPSPSAAADCSVSTSGDTSFIEERVHRTTWQARSVGWPCGLAYTPLAGAEFGVWRVASVEPQYGGDGDGKEFAGTEAEVEPGRHHSPRHRMPCNSIQEGSKCVG